MHGALAIDIGGTKLAAAYVDAGGRVHHAAAVPTPRASAADADELFATVVALARRVCAAAGDAPVTVCGVGCGGPMTPGGATVSPLNIPRWRGFPLRDRLAEAVDLPVVIDNDAKALTLGEGWCGAARGERNYLAMVVSTGVGAGLVVDGVLLDGAAANAGHIGHVIAVPGGRRCACGARGCLEAEASGSAIAAWTGAPAAQAPPSVRERTGRLVGEVVGSVVHLLDIRLAVVGGSVALGFGAPFFAAAQRALDETARLEYARGARIVPAGLGANSPLVGAAAVGLRAMGIDVAGCTSTAPRDSGGPVRTRRGPH